MIQIDIPMPERCGVCFAMHTDEIGLESWCGIDETARDLYTADINTKRPEWCPLKEQEAVEPGIAQDVDGIFATCGKCKKKIWKMMGLEFVVNPDEMPRFCPQCGQAVKWDA